jgi:hypothetical protein
VNGETVETPLKLGLRILAAEVGRSVLKLRACPVVLNYSNKFFLQQASRNGKFHERTALQIGGPKHELGALGRGSTMILVAYRHGCPR